MAKNKDYFSTTELAVLLGISRIAVYKKIISGEIKAEKVGRNYIIPKSELEAILGVVVPERRKHKIGEAVNKATREYKEALQKLGEE